MEIETLPTNISNIFIGKLLSNKYFERKWRLEFWPIIGTFQKFYLDVPEIIMLMHLRYKKNGGQNQVTHSTLAGIL